MEEKTKKRKEKVKTIIMYIFIIVVLSFLVYNIAFDFSYNATIADFLKSISKGE